MKRFHFTAAAVAAACVLTACGGGGGNDDTPRVSISSVKVTGASLADSGTFGYKFTVQPAQGSGNSYKLYSERIAAAYGRTLCNFFATADLVNFTVNTGCTNYAVAGGAVNYSAATAGGNTINYAVALDTVPLSAIKQLQVAGAAGYSSSELLLVGEFAANDVATIATFVGNVLGGSNASTNTAYFSNLMKTLLASATVDAKIGSLNGIAELGGLYMTAVADKLFDAVVANALNKGAQRVVMLNTLDVTQTPKFQAQLALLSASNAQLATGTVRAWIQAFNSRLATRAAAYPSRVAVVDFYTSFNDEMADPAQYGLTNVANTVCDELVNQATTTTVVTAGSVSLAPTSPSVRAACTDQAAATLTPQHDAVNGTNWWKTYLFADNFHPTPYGHQLLGQLVAKRLTEAGWL